MERILIVDDDKTFVTQISMYIEDMGYAWDAAYTLKEAINQANQQMYDLVFLDVLLPDESGLNGISLFKDSPASPEVVIITGRGDPEGAEMALKNGAWHYIEKPAAFHDIELMINRVSEFRKNKKKFYEKTIITRDSIIGNDASLRNCLEQVAKAAGIQGNVLITGESGTGKELFARAVHENSPQADKPFVVVDCTNITPTLASSLLFGHKKGTFTGADRDSDGLVRQANQGILFLDEIGDLPLETQSSLLRVLQNKTYRPLGAGKEIPCEFRVVSATNRNLKNAISDGNFREDLYYRLSTIHIGLPPLRKRNSDIPLLVNHYVNDICKRLGIDTKGVSKDFYDTLKQYHWPGNIRELMNILQTAIAEGIHEPVLYPHALPVDIRINILKKDMMANRNSISMNTSQPNEVYPPLPGNHNLPKFKDYHDIIESAYLNRLMTITQKNIQDACNISGFSRARLYQLFKKHGIKGIRG